MDGSTWIGDNDLARCGACGAQPRDCPDGGRRAHPAMLSAISFILDAMVPKPGECAMDLDPERRSRAACPPGALATVDQHSRPDLGHFATEAMREWFRDHMTTAHQALFRSHRRPCPQGNGVPNLRFLHARKASPSPFLVERRALQVMSSKSPLRPQRPSPP